MKERRRVLRRPILETFSVFGVVPKKGQLRLSIKDLSELGIGFDLDIKGQKEKDLPVSVGQRLEFNFYLNQSLFVPLAVNIMRIEEHDEIRFIGAEFADPESKNCQAIRQFVIFLDLLNQVGQF